MNVKANLEEFVATSADLINTIMLMLDTQSAAIKAATLEVLAPMVLFSDDGHARLLASLDYFKYKKHESRRFQTLVEQLRHEKDRFVRFNSLIFINSFVVFFSLLPAYHDEYLPNAGLQSH
jgi:hypothetical protein